MDVQQIFITLEGEATLVANERELQVGAGDIVVVPPHTPHAFTSSGSVPLRQIDIHVSPSSKPSGSEVGYGWLRPRFSSASQATAAS